MADEFPTVFRSLRETGPALLVPLAWTFVTATHLGWVTDHTLFVAHVVMSVLLAGFAITGRVDMREGVLLVWWRVIAVGFFATAAGTAGFLLESTSLFAVALYGWMLLPAVGLAYTGRQVTDAQLVYGGGALLCVLGAVVYAAAPVLPAETAAVVTGLAAVGIGQTAGIVDAVYRY